MAIGLFNRQDGNTALMEDMEQRLQERMTALVKRIDCLEKEIVWLKEELVRRPQPAPVNVEEKTEKLEETSVETVPQAQTLYLSAPNADGTFSSCSPQEDVGTSLFVLHSEDGRTGTFAFLNTSDALATALISITQFLKPVCKIQGKATFMPRSIATEQEGGAFLDGTTWTMTQKAVVRFIE